MKIRIIKDMSAENNSTFPIKKFIGKVFNAEYLADNSVDVDFGEYLGEYLGTLHVFEGEYEIVES